MAGEAHREAARIVLSERWAALATLSETGPLAAMVAYAPDPDLTALTLHLSQLALHTRNLLADPRASLVVTRPDPGTGDPQLLPRVSLQGHVSALEEGEPGYDEAKAAYLSRFPDAAERFDLGDFVLFRFVPEEARYVGGFGRALRTEAAHLTEAAREIGAPG